MAYRSRVFRSQVVIPILAFVAGFLVGWVFIQHIAPPTVLTDSAIRITGKYKLVSPILVCNSAQASDFAQDTELQNKINAAIAAAKRSGEATDVSVYFRGFSGHWVGINDSEQYAPASLLKVPIMIAYFYEAEQQPGLLSEKLTYTGATDLNGAEQIRSVNDLKPGSYTIDQLIKATIEYSDNNALALLVANMDTTWLSEVYTDLGLSLTPDDSATAENITAKQFSYFFRILYNATYLTPEDSEKALEYLAASDFPQGLKSTVPADIPVASKFGERTIINSQGVVQLRELHDCGFVYAPGNNYVLCVMTRGTDFGQLTNVIDTIGKITYDEVAGK